MNANETTDRPLRGRRIIAWILALGSLGLYLATLSRGAFPGAPARNLVWHLHLDAFPTLLDPIWGLLVRQMDTQGNVALWTGLLSAVCGALCIFLLTSLVMRVRYAVHEKEDEEEVERELQARRLAGVTAGLALAVSIPFWVLSTRSMPGTFHLLLLLSATWLFSEYQRCGKTGFLYVFGILYGIGIAEFATFALFAPLAVLLVARAMLQRAAFRWSVMIRTGLCALPGMLVIYLLNANFLWRTDPSVPLRGYRSMLSVLAFMGRDQWNLIASAPMITGFLMVLMLTGLPWIVLFLIRSKKPAWRYGIWQVGLRVMVLLAAVGTVFNAPLCPWHFFGMYYPMVTPYVILAACVGYVAGEFWVMGQTRTHRNAGIGHPMRKTFGVIGLLLPVAMLIAGGLNFRVADGRPGTAIDRILQNAVQSLNGRDVLLSTGVLDDGMRLAAHQLKIPLKVISMPQTSVEAYRKYLALTFSTPRQRALLQVGFGAFIQDYLSNDAQLVKTAALDAADALREFGYLTPDALAYGAVPTPDRVNWTHILQTKIPPFRQEMEALKNSPANKNNPAYPYEQFILRIASKTFNNIGFAQVELDNTDAAIGLFQTARELYSDNLSALLNLLTIARDKESPDLPALEADWQTVKDRGLNSRVLWSLGSLYGYVHNAGYLIRNGMMWAVSGRPKMAEAELRRAAGGKAVDPAAKAFLARAFLEAGDWATSAKYYREAIEANSDDIASILKLVDLSLGANDLENAEMYLQKAKQAGASAEAVEFPSIVLSYLRGNHDEALLALKARTQKNKSDVRAWSFLAFLTGNGSDMDTYEQALKAIKSLRGSSPETRLLLAELYGNRKEWAEARSELDQVLRMNPRMIQAWEMLVNADFQERKRDLAEDHVRMLLTLDPHNYEGNLMLASFQYDRGQHSLAEASYRAALQARRTPIVLNDLSYLLLSKGEMEEAQALINEALTLQPNDPLLLSTRGELYLRMGRLDEAETDLQQVLSVLPDQKQVKLLCAELYFARGQTDAAKELATELHDNQHELPPEQQTRLQELLKKLP